MIHEIIVPQLGVNDEFITIVEWFVNDKDKVNIGTPLCVIETSKATFEIEAEYEGYVRISKKAGEEAQIKEVIGYIVSSLNIEIKKEGWLIESKSEVKEKSILSQRSGIKVTKKARELAQSLNIDLELIDKKSGIIRETDVKKFYESKKREHKNSQ